MNPLTPLLKVRYFLLLGLGAFLFLNLFGLSSFGMSMSSDGHMSECPFMGVTAVCQMSPSEHISAWQHMFTATTTENTLALLLLICAAVIFAYCLNRQLYPEIRASLLSQPPDPSFFKSPLQEAFSNGILNSKAY